MLSEDCRFACKLRTNLQQHYLLRPAKHTVFSVYKVRKNMLAVKDLTEPTRTVAKPEIMQRVIAFLLISLT